MEILNTENNLFKKYEKDKTIKILEEYNKNNKIDYIDFYQIETDTFQIIYKYSDKNIISIKELQLKYYQELKNKNIDVVDLYRTEKFYYKFLSTYLKNKNNINKNKHEIYFFNDNYTDESSYIHKQNILKINNKKYIMWNNWDIFVILDNFDLISMFECIENKELINFSNIEVNNNKIIKIINNIIKNNNIKDVREKNRKILNFLREINKYIE